MAKRKTQKPDTAACGMPIAGEKPRRSIPVEEVNKIVEHAVRDIKASRTIYDDRVDLLKQKEKNEQEIFYHEEILHRLRLRNKELRIELDKTNLAITRQMELDVE